MARARCAAIVACSALCFPAAAAAHVGRTVPVATDFVARIGSVPHGIEARVIDGDQSLWLRVALPQTVLVLGFSGEPYLRFTPTGVQANERSPTWFLNRARPGTIVPHPSPHTVPLWKTVAHGRAYRWHEDRLHALAVAARTPGSQYAGTWTLPLRIDGRPAQIRGGLWHVDPPSLLWFWPAVVLLACLPAFLRLRRDRLTSALGTTLLLIAAAAVAVAGAGRLLYGRPDVSAAQEVELGLLAVVIAFVLRQLLRRRPAVGTGIVVGAGTLALGLSWIGTLLHGHVIAALPAAIERAAVVGCLGGGTSLLAATLFVPVAGGSGAGSEARTHGGSGA